MRFWIGFALAFTMLLVASCGALFAVTGLDQVSLAELQGGGPEWTPPPITPTVESLPAAVSTPLAADGEALFRPGQSARNITNSRVNVRSTAGYLSKAPNDTLMQLMPGAAVEILGPTAAADGLTWWLIRTEAGGEGTIEGWVAEATASGVRILGQ